MEELSKQLYSHLYQSIKILDKIILDLKGNRREYKSDYSKNLEATKKELEYIFTNLRTVLKPEHKNLFRRTLREVVYESSFETEFTGHDPQLNKYSWKVKQTPVAEVIDLLEKLEKALQRAVETYPEQEKLDGLWSSVKSVRRDLNAHLRKPKNKYLK
jgi:hypothetical protein